MDKHTRISTRSKNVVVMTCCKLIHTETLPKGAFYVKMLFFDLNFNRFNRTYSPLFTHHKGDSSQYDS